MGHVRERRTPAGIEYFHWDPLGRIVHRFGAEELWFDYPPGQMIVRRPSGAMVWRFDLDDRGRRTKRWGDPYDHDVWEQSTFDERGQLTHFETLGDTFTFTYDGGRVVESVIDTAYRPKCTMRIAYRGDDHVSFVDATPERGAPSHCRYAFDDQSRLTRATCTRGVTSVTVAWTYEGEWVIASGVAGHMERHHRSCAYPPRSIEGIVQPEVYGIEPRAIDSVGPMVRVPAPSVVCTE
jgi:hypothetical protein